MTGDDINGEDMADIDMTKMDDVENDVIQVVDDGEAFIYTGDDQCNLCWRDAIAVMVKDAEFRKVHGAVCEKHIKEVEQKDEDSQYEVRYFD